MANSWRNPLFLWDRPRARSRNCPPMPIVSPQTVLGQDRAIHAFRCCRSGACATITNGPATARRCGTSCATGRRAGACWTSAANTIPRRMRAREDHRRQAADLVGARSSRAGWSRRSSSRTASQNTLFAAGALFGIYAAINLCWMLILGTASIYSLASYAVVGAAAYGIDLPVDPSSACPGGCCPLSAAASGSSSACIIAIPATRLDGFYYALLTLGLNELCRVYVLQSQRVRLGHRRPLWRASYIPKDWSPARPAPCSAIMPASR